MKRILISLAVLGLLADRTQADEPTVKASPQSVECFFPDRDNDEVLCTVRVHLTPAPGHIIRTRSETARPKKALTATDGTGQKLEGFFREWELCYDSDSNCVIAVYDFKMRPQGGELRVDTALDIPASGELVTHEPVTFTPTAAVTLTSGNQVFHITPTESGAQDPDNTVLRIEYDNTPDIADITIRNEKNEQLPTEIIDGYIHSDNGKANALYILTGKYTTLQFCLRTYKQCDKIEVPLKFRATIGR